MSDPGYDNDTWCAGVVKNCLPGIWEGYLSQSDEGEWGMRVSMVVARHKDCSTRISACDLLRTDEEKIYWDSPWKLVDFEIGVDSGQAGIFDENMFRNEAQFTSFPRDLGWECDSKWYANCCALTLSEKSGGVIPCGVVSSSGFGDGIYSGFIHVNRSNQVDIVAIVF